MAIKRSFFDHPDFEKYKNVNPRSVHAFVYYKNKWGQLDDMPFNDWYRLQQDPRRRDNFEYVRIVDMQTVRKEAVQGAAPVVEDPYECPLCGFVALNDAKLLEHKTTIHA